jgi:quercetin dioxygenase-like cupin family protein
VTTGQTAHDQYPHTIDDGAGSRMTFLGGTPDALQLTSTVSPGAGPPMHVHHLQEEEVTVREGRLGYTLEGQEERFAGPGETVRFQRGVAHTFRNAGDEDLQLEGVVSPPLNFEYFLSRVYEATAATGGKRPRTFDAAFLTTRYRSEFAMSDIPAPVQRVLFPLVAAVGRLAGKGRRFAGAPAPVVR